MRRPGFRVEGVRYSAPFRSRRVYADYQMFSDGSGTVLVKPDVAMRLREAAAVARPRETGGLLSGRPLHDDGGSYVIVSGYIEAEADAGRTDGFHLAPDAVAGLSAKAARADPGAEIIGWWHSHFVPSKYSPTDRQTQRVYQQPDRVGLLVFAQGEPWANAYLGPESRDLGGPRRVAGRPSPPRPTTRPPTPRPHFAGSRPPGAVPPVAPGARPPLPGDNAPGLYSDTPPLLMTLVIAIVVAAVILWTVTSILV